MSNLTTRLPCVQRPHETPARRFVDFYCPVELPQLTHASQVAIKKLLVDRLELLLDEVADAAVKRARKRGR